MRKFILSTLVIAGAVFAGAAAPAHAGLSLVTSVGALGANDSIDWVFGAGAQIQADYYGGFTAQILASNGAVLGSFTENGTSDCCSNTAIFIGLLSTTANIASIEFTLTAAAYDTTSDFAIGPVALTTGVPELGTWAMMIIGFGGVALQLRRRTGAMAIAA